MKKVLPILCLLLCMSFLLAGCQGNNKKNEFFITEDLSGKKIGIIEGITSEDTVTSKISNAKIRKYDTVDEGIKALKDRKITALVLNAELADPIIKKDTSITSMIEKLSDRAYVAATLVPSDNVQDDFTMEINATTSKIRGDGSYEKLYNKYFGKNAGEPDTSNIAYNKGKTKRILTVGFEENNKPFSYKDATGKLVGFDVEFANEVAKTWGATLVVKEYPRDKLLAAAKKGEVKMALGRITAADNTDEKDYFFTSAPYFDASQLIILNAADAGKNPLK